MIAASIAAIALCPPPALAAGGDAASTRTYIQANYALMRVAASSIHPIEATLRALQSRIRRECPMAAAGSPQDPQSTQLSNELIGELVLTAGRLIRPAVIRFTALAAHVSWSDRALTRTIHAYAANLRTLTALRPPDICSDVRSWAAGAFKTLPASTVSFASRFIAAWVAPGEMPAALTRFESTDERPLIARTTGLETAFIDLEAREVETWGRIMNALDLWP